jgi:hypothetical protein
MNKGVGKEMEFSTKHHILTCNGGTEGSNNKKVRMRKRPLRIYFF